MEMSGLPETVIIAPVKKCKFYVKKKNRFCQLVAMKDLDYCAEHFANGTEEEYARAGRVPCPYDPKHSARIEFFKQHLEICNKRPRPPEPYYSKGLNSGASDKVPEESLSLSELSPEQLDRLVELVYTICQKRIPMTNKAYGKFDTVEADINAPGLGHPARRHLVQISSLLSFLESEKLLAPSTCFLELGCGRATLTFHLAEGLQTKIENPESCRFVLIDRESHRHKRDNKLKDQIHLDRIRVDLADLKLEEVESVKISEHTVGYSKHLCGEATDLALKCLLETNSSVDKLRGIVIANCCHHKCNYATYVGKKYLEEWGFKPDDFKALTGISSWAVCGTGSEGFAEIKWDINDMALGWVPVPRMELTLPMKRTLGMYAKRILDYGRVLYVSSFGFTAYLSTYVEQTNTLENVAMVAKKELVNTE